LDKGYRLVYLGADTPFAELTSPANRSNADAVLLSGSVVTDTSNLSQGISELVESIDVPVFVGGEIAIRHTGEIEAARAIPLGTDISQALHKINEVIANQR